MRGIAVEICRTSGAAECSHLVSPERLDNIRNVIGCPVAGLTDDELFDASSVVRDFNEAFLRNKAFTNLPRKFNVAITGCTENCTHGETQDLSLTPAIKIIAGEEVKGFNIAVGGKIGVEIFKVGQRVKLQFRAEMYNIFNTVNFRADSLNLAYDAQNVVFDTGNSATASRVVSATAPGNFGQVNSARDPRTMQFGLRLSF